MAGTSCGQCDGRPVGRPRGSGDAIRTVSRNGMHLSDLPPEVRERREVVFEAVSSTGLALQYASGSMRSDREVVLAALRRDDVAAAFVDQALLADPEVQGVLAQAREGDTFQDVNAEETLICWTTEPAAAWVPTRCGPNYSAQTVSQHTRDLNRMEELRALAPSDSITRGLVAADDMRVCIPTADEAAAIEKLANKYKLDLGFAHLIVVWWVHVALLRGGEPIPKDIMPLTANGLLQTALLPLFAKGFSSGRITPPVTLVRARGRYAAGERQEADSYERGLVDRVLGACGCDGVATEAVLAVWLFYVLCFRWFADISGFESLLEVCGGVLAEPEEWIGRVRRVLSGCPTAAYLFGSTNDGRRWLVQAHICERLNSLQWRVQFPGQRNDHASPMRALAFVAYVGDWWLAAQKIASICVRLKVFLML